MDARAPLCLVACSDASDLTARIAAELGVAPTASRDVWFACGEGKHVIEANVRGADVYVIQGAVAPGTPRSVYDRWMMTLHAVDAARCADADRVVVVLPYLPGSRQDKRKDQVREGVSTGLFARMLEAAGASMLVTVEPHNDATIGCFDPRRCVFESVDLTGPLARWLDRQGLRCDVVGSTDVGGLEMARHVAQELSADMVALSKERDYSRPSVVTHSTVIGDVAGRSVLVIDDIVDTAGSMCAAVRALWEQGATDVVAAGVHCLLSDPAWSRLHDLRADAEARGVRFELVMSSSVVHPNPPPWARTYDLVPLLAKVIGSVNRRGSVRAIERG